MAKSIEATVTVASKRQLRLRFYSPTSDGLVMVDGTEADVNLARAVWPDAKVELDTPCGCGGVK